jgi:hypothetical protein
VEQVRGGKAEENREKFEKFVRKTKVCGFSFCAILRVKFGWEGKRRQWKVKRASFPTNPKHFATPSLRENRENSIRIHPSREKPINHRPISFTIFSPSLSRTLQNISELED